MSNTNEDRCGKYLPATDDDTRRRVDCYYTVGTVRDPDGNEAFVLRGSEASDTVHIIGIDNYAGHELGRGRHELNKAIADCLAAVKRVASN